jgi:hypothetical protein
MASIIGVETLQHTNGTTAMEIDSSGRITKPNAVAWHAYKDNGNVSGSGTDIIWNKTHTNVGNMYSNTTGEVTIPVAGLYFIYVFGMSNSGANDILWFQLVKNGSNFQGFNPYGAANGTGGGHFQVAGQIVLDLAVNDTIRIDLGNNSAATMWSNSANTHNGFGGYLIG